MGVHGTHTLLLGETPNTQIPKHKIYRILFTNVIKLEKVKRTDTNDSKVFHL